MEDRLRTMLEQAAVRGCTFEASPAWHFRFLSTSLLAGLLALVKAAWKAGRRSRMRSSRFLILRPLGGGRMRRTQPDAAQCRAQGAIRN